MSSSAIGGAIAFVVGCALAAATAFGVVQSQQSAGASTPDTAVSYGNS